MTGSISIVMLTYNNFEKFMENKFLEETFENLIYFYSAIFILIVFKKYLFIHPKNNSR